MLVSRQAFRAKAPPVSVVINGVPFVARMKEMKTGSFGWHLGGKTRIVVAGEVQHVQITMNMTVIGSKGAQP